MSETTISEIKLETSEEEFSSDDNVTVNVRFSVMGNLRESLTEKKWTQASERNDKTIKLK